MLSEWAVAEVGSAELGDKRLPRRLKIMLSAIGNHPNLSIPAACGGWNAGTCGTTANGGGTAQFLLPLRDRHSTIHCALASAPLVLYVGRGSGVLRWVMASFSG